jgi:hypothetical protein
LEFFMRPLEVRQALACLVPLQRSIYLWGPPGVGKSSLVQQLARQQNLELIDLRVTLLDPVDLRGLPRLNKTKVDWCSPSFLPTKGSGILFLDELAQATPLVQAACLQLTLDRRIGEYQLPDGWTVIAASNRSEDRAGTHRLITPLLNRFIHLDLEVSNEDWQDWAMQTGIVPEVRAFLRFRPNLLFQFDSTQGTRSFATPRSWQFVSELFATTPKAILHPVVQGCIGDGPAAEFIAFLQLYDQLPEPSSIFQYPESSPIPREPAVLYALLGALIEKCKSEPLLLQPYVRYITRLPEEFGLLGLRDALTLQPALASHASIQSWISKARQRGLFLAV